MQVTVALPILAVPWVCPAPGMRTGVDARSDTMVKPRELSGYPKAVGVRLERFDGLARCGLRRAGGRTAMATAAKAREGRTRFGGRVDGTPGPGPGNAFGSGGTAAPGQFGERLMRVRLADAC